MITKIIRGTSKNDTRRGKGANEQILGLGGDDRLYGLGGDDVLLGGEGEDRLEGGVGNDRLEGGNGNDVLAGGNGDDFYVLVGEDRIGGETGKGGIDTVQASFSISFVPASFENFENIVLVGGKALEAYGNRRSNTLTGNGAANRLFGNNGNDTLIGLAGKDQLSGGLGRDTLIGGKGDDLYAIDNAGDRAIEEFNQGDDTLQAGINFSLTAAPNIENLSLFSAAFSGEGNSLDNDITGNTRTNNTLRGGLGNDELTGQGGADTLFGEEGDDELEGNDGNDSLDGGAGADRLLGGSGNDILVGGAGADEFVYDAGRAFDNVAVIGQDAISDFAVDVDAIVLDKETFAYLRSSSGTGFSNSSEFDRVSSDAEVVNNRALIVYSTQTGNLYYNLTGIGGGRVVFAQFSGAPNLAARDFVIQS